jgi:asparagine synthase (glutamine-hydrolysing)
VREDGIKVILGGHGADELFYGYTGHVRTRRVSTLLSLVGSFAAFVERLAGCRKGWSVLSIAGAQPGARKAAYYREREKHDWPLVLAPGSQNTVTNVVA